MNRRQWRASPAGQSFEITPVHTKADRRAFLEVPYRAYQDDPAWRAPLRMMQSDQLSPAKNPGLRDLDHGLFLARRGGRVVGRVAAAVNKVHQARYQNLTGHFGFLDTLQPDPNLVAALLDTAAEYLHARGMVRMLGPFNLSINEECGLLVDGFTTPPMIMMPHGRPDYAPAYEASGLTCAKEMHAFHYRFPPGHQPPDKVRRIKAAVEREPELVIRRADMRRFKSEMGHILDMFNDAWSANWEFLPFSADQISHMASELRPLVSADAFRIAEWKGKPIAFAVFLPDLNELAHGLDGRLLPLGWAKLLYRLKMRGPRRARLPLAGLRRKYHKTKLGFLAASGSFEAAVDAQFRQGVEEIEASWVLDDNVDLIAMCRTYGMTRYKTYRIYEKAIA